MQLRFCASKYCLDIFSNIFHTKIYTLKLTHIFAIIKEEINPSGLFRLIIVIFINIRQKGEKMHKLKISTLPILILCYGIFASLCHAVMLLLYFRTCPTESFFLSFSRFFPLLEHSLVSFVCVLFGALLCFYIDKKEGVKN